MSIATITLSEFRKESGEYIRAVQREGRKFLLTKAGKPAAMLVPFEEAMVRPPRSTVKRKTRKGPG